MLRRVVAARYVLPLREGGSLPAVVEAEDGRAYVVKFRAAGQGARSLVAEIVVGELGRVLGLPVPELVLVELDEAVGRNEGDPEIRDLVVASAGDNVGMAFLANAMGFDPAARPKLDPVLAARIVAFDAFAQNVDRTAKNTNLLWCTGQLWLIDHGAALYWQHDWDGGLAGADARFPLIARHVLLPWAAPIAAEQAWLTAGLSDGAIEAATLAVPEAWWTAPPDLPPEAYRVAFAARLKARRDAAAVYLEEADRARTV
ncbi:HipA family kinase [Nannocystis pusilla]|uniref:Aminotransferase class I and II n=1 Tax=Nannocystis pusilla TaxID=889268 RepID=A0ABS7TXA2_9BACT|nr:HipA family kinase [Nannocystis pusilla]MBZ5712833.1 aminotransferase class I and II [Nannocystis pusilla]